jgi:hypothetical protein
MILGIVGLVMLLGIPATGCFACFGFGPSAGAIALGHLGLGNIRKSQGTLGGDPFGLTALITGYLAIFIWGVLFLLAVSGIAAVGIFAKFFAGGA